MDFDKVFLTSDQPALNNNNIQYLKYHLNANNRNVN